MPKKTVKKKVAKKAVKKAKPKAAKAAPKVKQENKKKVGTITHFYNNINVGVISLSDTLKKGDTISIEGETTNFKQKVDSMQIDREEIKEAKKGQEIGMKVKDRVREHDIVYKVG